MWYACVSCGVLWCGVGVGVLFLFLFPLVEMVQSVPCSVPEKDKPMHVVFLVHA